MQYNANAALILETHQQIKEVLDGDSIVIRSKFTQSEKVIRLYGLDAPEVKKGRKLIEDEEKTHLPAEFLMQLGRRSLNYFLSLAPPGTNITITTEKNNKTDYWKRQLAYIILSNGACLNEILVREGYAKASHHYWCTELEKYQLLNADAKTNKKGLYAITEVF